MRRRIFTEFPRPSSVQEKLKVAETVAELVCHASRELHMKLIAVFTHSGFTARLVSRYRPMVPIVAFTPEAETRRRMALIWGVMARGIADVKKVDGLAEVAEQRLLEEKLGEERGCDWDCGGDADGDSGDDEFYEVSCGGMRAKCGRISKNGFRRGLVCADMGRSGAAPVHILGRN